MKKHAWIRYTPIALAAALSLTACGGDDVAARPVGRQNVVVIYAENRSFDNLYGNFPGANGLQNATAANSVQKDRDGSTMATLPKIWAADRDRHHAGGDRGDDGEPAEHAVRDRRSERLQPVDEHRDARHRASLLLGPDADQRRQERHVCRVDRCGRPDDGPLHRRSVEAAAVEGRAAACWPTTSSWVRSAARS